MCFELDSVPPIPPISGGAPVRFEEYAEQSADAWARVLAFIERYTPPGA